MNFQKTDEGLMVGSLGVSFARGLFTMSNIAKRAFCVVRSDTPETEEQRMLSRKRITLRTARCCVARSVPTTIVVTGQILKSLVRIIGRITTGASEGRTKWPGSIGRASFALIRVVIAGLTKTGTSTTSFQSLAVDPALGITSLEPVVRATCARKIRVYLSFFLPGCEPLFSRR